MLSFLSFFQSSESPQASVLPRRAASLRSIVDRIRNSLRLDVVLQTAVDEVGDLLDLDCCLFFWYFADLERVQVVCQSARDETPRVLGHYPLEALGSIAPFVEQGELIDNVSHRMGGNSLQLISNWVTRWHVPADELRLFGYPVTLLVPVPGQDSSMGFMACLSERPRSWVAADLEFIQAIAQQLEIAIRQAQLYERTQKQAHRERLVNQITTQTRQSLDVKTILPGAIAHLLDALEVDRCLVHLVEPLDSDDELNLAKDSSQILSMPGGLRSSPLPHGNATAAKGKAMTGEVFRRKHLFEACRDPFLPSIQDFDTNGPITHWVIENRQQVVIPDVTQDSRIGAENPEYQLAQICSSLVVPVQANGRLYAILYLNQCSKIRYWSKDDRKLAQAVADQLAISIQQAHLYHQTQQQAQQSAAQAQSLAEALAELRRTQAQLIQSEKMSSLGQLVAGVAHEINNPVSFIYGNIPYVERYVADLLTLIDHYQQETPDPSVDLQALASKIELAFLRQDLPHILQSMRDGSSRIRAIVASLRNFARLDEASCKVVDVHEGLDSTLAVVGNQMGDAITIQQHYGELPLVECYPAALNQVFLNLMINAAEALEQSTKSEKVVTVTTELCDSPSDQEMWVRIRISDNGCGVSPRIQDKIFDPFFTTKEIGRGTGLGLAVGYQIIVNQHQGRLDFTSTPNEGAEFIVEIPVTNSAAWVRDRNRYLQTDPSSASRLVS